MKEFIEKLIGRLEERKQLHNRMIAYEQKSGTVTEEFQQRKAVEVLDDAIEIVNQLAEEYKDKKVLDMAQVSTDYAKARMEELKRISNNGWIPCSERLPEVEIKVLIHAKRKYRDGSFRDIITTAMYEDGTMLENDSKWRWEDIEGEWDEENDCYIIPEGWWEDKMYNADGELNHAVDDEVIEWQPLPELYQLER